MQSLAQSLAHSLAQGWRHWAAHSVSQAWGLAPQGVVWSLVGLTRQSPTLVRVNTSQSLPIPGGHDPDDLSWLSPKLRHNGRLQGGFAHRLNLALTPTYVQEGFIVLPASLPEEDWPFEIQLEVARVFQVAHDAVSFDFEADAAPHDSVRRIHWIGCAQMHMAAFKNFTRAAGWRLAAVEPEGQAAERGARALQGGVASLLTQAPQDWQFHLKPRGQAHPEGVSSDSEATLLDALARVLNTPTGARLVASGAALKAWL